MATPNLNIYDRLSAGYASNPAVVFLRESDGSSHTFDDIDRRSRQLATVLRESGLEPGDRLIARVEKSPDAFVLYLASLLAGIVYVPLNTAYTIDEVSYFVDDAEAALVVSDQSILDGLAEHSCDRRLLSDLVLAANAAEPTTTATGGGDDLAAMIYTSGTTGRSKGAMLSHANVIANAEALHDVWAFEPGDVLLHTLPIFHVHGLMIAMHPAMINGSEVIFLPRFGTDDVLGQLSNASVLMGVPTHYVRLLGDDRFGTEVASHMRLFTSGSAPMTEQIHAEFTARTGRQIVERYGMSECGIITSNPCGGECVPGTVGFPLPGVEIRIADQSGTLLAPGETGTVETRGPSLFNGYWRRPEKTDQEHRPDGFFVTGDVGSMDENGRLTLEGRMSDMIISGGYNVYPKEIEIVLDDIPGIVESAVVGLPHHDFGEAVTAFIVAGEKAPDQDVLEAALQSIARFKHPKRTVVLDELPRNAMAKVQKVALRERYADLYDH